MEQFYLEKVTLNRKQEIIDYIKELYKYKSRINGVGRLQDFINQDQEDFEGWFDKIKKEEKAELPRVCYLFIRKNDNKLIGMINIRMTENLKDYLYGNVGYSIRPTERNKGYGKIQFYLALKEMKKNKINNCIMCCKEDNEESRKVIKALGGVFKEKIDIEEYYLLDIEKSIQYNFSQYNKYRA